MGVNDPVLKQLDEWLLRGNGVDWNRFWDFAEEKIGADRLHDYIHPSRNDAMQVIDTYKRGTSQIPTSP